MKRISVLLFIILTVLMSVSAFSANSIPEEELSEPVRVKIDGTELDSKFKAFIYNQTTIVPLRAVMETLDCQVKWTHIEQPIIISKENTEISILIGSDTMTVNGKTLTLPVPALLIGSTTYVPIRAISESLGARVGWENEDRSAGISTTGTYGTLSVGNYKVSVGSTATELINACGEPSYKTIGENGLMWYVYAVSPSLFMAVATDAGFVCGYYTNSPYFSTSEGAVYGAGVPEGVSNYRKLDGDGYTISEYYDKEQNMLYAIHYMRKGFYNNHDINAGLAGQARIGLDILNCFRAANGLSPLLWDTPAAMCSTDHAKYMASVGNLTHNGADGSSAIKRYQTYNPVYVWSSWGENICAGADSIYLCINGWINSSYHRAAMLTDKQYAGIGLIHDPNGIYKYTAAMFLFK